MTMLEGAFWIVAGVLLALPAAWLGNQPMRGLTATQTRRRAESILGPAGGWIAAVAIFAPGYVICAHVGAVPVLIGWCAHWIAPEIRERQRRATEPD